MVMRAQPRNRCRASDLTNTEKKRQRAISRKLVGDRGRTSRHRTNADSGDASPSGAMGGASQHVLAALRNSSTCSRRARARETSPRTATAEIEAALEHAEKKGAKPGAIETLDVGERRPRARCRGRASTSTDTLHASRDTVTGEDRLQTGGHPGPERLEMRVRGGVQSARVSRPAAIVTGFGERSAWYSRRRRERALLHHVGAAAEGTYGQAPAMIFPRQVRSARSRSAPARRRGQTEGR